MPTAKNVLKEKKILAKISASFNRGQDKEVASTRNTDGKDSGIRYTLDEIAKKYGLEEIQ